MVCLQKTASKIPAKILSIAQRVAVHLKNHKQSEKVTIPSVGPIGIWCARFGDLSAPIQHSFVNKLRDLSLMLSLDQVNRLQLKVNNYFYLRNLERPFHYEVSILYMKAGCMILLHLYIFVAISNIIFMTIYDYFSVIIFIY